MDTFFTRCQTTNSLFAEPCAEPQPSTFGALILNYFNILSHGAERAEPLPKQCTCGHAYIRVYVRTLRVCTPEE